MVKKKAGLIVVVLVVVLFAAFYLGSYYMTANASNCYYTTSTVSENPSNTMVDHTHRYCVGSAYTEDSCTSTGICHKHAIVWSSNVTGVAGQIPHHHTLAVASTSPTTPTTPSSGYHY